MEEELFRFVVARPPRSLPRDEVAKKVTEPYKKGLSQVAEMLAKAGDQAHMRGNALIESPQFVRHLNDVSPALARLDDWLLFCPSAAGSELRRAVKEHVIDAPTGPNDPGPAAWRERLADSLLALTLCSFSPFRARST